jgi:hypothetical protein
MWTERDPQLIQVSADPHTLSSEPGTHLDVGPTTCQAQLPLLQISLLAHACLPPPPATAPISEPLILLLLRWWCATTADDLCWPLVQHPAPHGLSMGLCRWQEVRTAHVPRHWSDRSQSRRRMGTLGKNLWSERASPSRERLDLSYPLPLFCNLCIFFIIFPSIWELGFMCFYFRIFFF